MKSILAVAHRRLLVRVLGGIAALTLFACGGGGGGIGDQAGVGTGGTGGASPAAVSIGPISGFGSVIVSGVRYDDTHAVVTDDEGNPRTRLDLRLGMVTEISGSADFVARSGVASAIRYGSEVLGPVSAVSTAAGTVTVLGVVVNVKPSTAFDDSLAGLSAIHVGDTLEVYGFYNVSTGAYTATRIEPKPAATRYKLRGPVAALDTAKKRFSIAGLVIDYSGLSAAQVPTLTNGAVVRASSARAPAAGVWRVDSLGSGLRASLAEGEAQVEGAIDSFSSASRFSVDGVVVDASAAAVSGTPAPGLRVQVEGTVRGGVLIAKQVEVKDEATVESEGFDLTDVIQSFDPLTLRFRLRGQLVDASGTVSYEAGTRADLANGVRIELKGVFDGASGAVLARLIHFER